MKIEVLKNVFEQNDNAARENRAALDAHKVVCVNLLGGDGAGKTALLEAVVPVLGDDVRAAVLEGDLATTKDAARIAAVNLPVVQLLTEGSCHLNATLVQHGLAKLPLDDLDLLIIENVGNPICRPTSTWANTCASACSVSPKATTSRRSTPCCSKTQTWWCCPSATCWPHGFRPGCRHPRRAESEPPG